MKLAPPAPILAAAVAAFCVGGPGPLGLTAPAHADGMSPDDSPTAATRTAGSSSSDADDNRYACPENTWTLCLQSSRFHVEIDWYTENDDASDDAAASGGADGDADGDDASNPNDGSDDDDTRGMAQVVHTTSDKSGLFYFFDPGNWEVLVKVLDGCGHNGYFWVYAAAATDVGFDIDVYDKATGHPPLQKQYRKPAGPPAPAHVDVTAFACEPAVPQ